MPETWGGRLYNTRGSSGGLAGEESRHATANDKRYRDSAIVYDGQMLTICVVAGMDKHHLLHIGTGGIERQDSKKLRQ